MIQGHPGPAAGHYTPFPGPHAPPPGYPVGLMNRSRALPVIVACGLAMGVFVGLVVVRGTGEAEGSSVTATVTPPAQAKAGVADREPVEADSKPAEAPLVPPPPPAADSTALLVFTLTPKEAVVTVDGSPVADGKAEVKLTGGKARVRLVAKAEGYRSYDKSHLVTGDEALSIELVKRPRRSSSSKSPSGPGGLIDLR